VAVAVAVAGGAAPGVRVGFQMVLLNTRAGRRVARAGMVPGLAALALCGVVAAAGPAAASTGESAVAVSDAYGLQVAVQPDGAAASDWSVRNVASGGTAAWGSPELFRQAGGLVLTDIRDDGSLWYFWQGAGASNWNAQEVAGPQSADSDTQPSIASQAVIVSGEATVTAIVAQDPSNDESTYYRQTNGGTGWSHEQVPTGTGIAEQPDVTVAADDTLVVTYVSTAASDTTSPGFGVDRLAYGSSSWSTLDVQTGANPLISISAIVQSDGNLLVGAADQAGDTYLFWNPAGENTTWYQEDVGTGGRLVDDLVPSVLPMALTGDDQGVALGAVSDSTGCDLVYDQADGASGWSSQNLACPYAMAPAALALDPGSHNEAAASNDYDNGETYCYWQADGSTTWHTEAIPGITGADAYTSAALAVS
jgi:hypothetical protein